MSLGVDRQTGRRGRGGPCLPFCSSSLSTFYPCVQPLLHCRSSTLTPFASFLPLFLSPSSFSFFDSASYSSSLKSCWNRARTRAAKAPFFFSPPPSLRELSVIEFFCIGPIFDDGNMLPRILDSKSISEFFYFTLTLDCTDYCFASVSTGKTISPYNYAMLIYIYFKNTVTVGNSRGFSSAGSLSSLS